MSDRPPPSAYRGPNPVLDEQWHRTLIARAPEFARSAGIPIHMLWTAASEYCSAEELDYLRNVYRAQKSGLYWVGAPASDAPTVLKRMQAMAAACLRNYHSARVMVLSDVIDAAREGEGLSDARYLFVPDFCTAKTQVRDWVASVVLALLIRREAEGLQTFLYVFDERSMASALGDAMAEHLRESMVRVAL